LENDSLLREGEERAREREIEAGKGERERFANWRQVRE